MEGRTKRRVKFGLSITPYILIVALSGGYALSDIGSDIKDAKVVEDVKKEVLLPEHPIIIDDRKDEQKRQDDIVEETPVIEPEEKINISSELLDQGYEFERIDFDELKQINPDSDAWIIIDGTKIDLPIVKSIDNEFYLHHNIEKKDSNSGTLFIDCRNQALSSDSLDDITFVYGHHMKGGRMLAGICNYKDESFYKNHEYGIIYTPDGYAYKASVVACTVVDGGSDENVFENNFDKKEEYLLPIQNEEELLMIYTCSLFFCTAKIRRKMLVVKLKISIFA